VKRTIEVSVDEVLKVFLTLEMFTSSSINLSTILTLKPSKNSWEIATKEPSKRSTTCTMGSSGTGCQPMYSGN